MTLIGFDTSLATTSACVLRSDGSAFSTPARDPGRLFEPAAHSQELLPELERLLGESGTTWQEIESIAVGIGPGTFTGLRIGVATARALGQALGVGLRPVSSLETLAAAVASADAGGSARPVLALIDARRRQVFAGLYRAAAGRDVRSPRNDEGEAAPLDRIWDPAVMDPDALLQAIGELELPPVCVGDWAIKSRKRLEDAGARVPPSQSGLHVVSGLHLCRLATSVDPVVPQDVYPVYLRLPDAEINRRRALRQTDDTHDR